MILTHDHADHAQGLPWIARRFGVRRWIGPHPSASRSGDPASAPWEGARHEPGPPRGSLLLGAPDGGLSIRVVRGGPFGGNEGSLAAELEVVGQLGRVVICGDAEGHGLAAMLGPGGLRGGPVDALLLPHHGSRSAHLGRLLDHLQPREVWVSASSTPRHVVNECRRRGLRLRSTARDGPWVWTVRPAGFGAKSPNSG